MATASLLLCSLVATASSSCLSRVAFVINSNGLHPHNLREVEQTKSQLETSLQSRGVQSPLVFAAADDRPPVNFLGSWTFFPALNGISDAVGFDWLVFLKENVDINVDLLVGTVCQLDHDQDHFLGFALRDKDIAVIHHYDPPGLVFPHPGAGIIISSCTVKRFHGKLKEMWANVTTGFPKHFHIDPSYELAKVLSSLDILLSTSETICPEKRCVIWPRDLSCNASPDDVLNLAKRTFFGVKTCEKYHEKRLPVIAETWKSAALNIELISEAESDEFGTLVLPGVVNTERGHCNKAMTIVNYFVERAEDKGWDWLVIADDDTMLGVSSLMEELKCYDGDKTVPVLLGQRYGFGVGLGLGGYDYITGGGSMVLNRDLAMKVAETCKCPSDNDPDDMFLGRCVLKVKGYLVHSDRFHQTRPEDYAEELLRELEPVSFHKFWNTKPVATYEKYFRESDKVLKEYKERKQSSREEL